MRTILASAGVTMLLLLVQKTNAWSYFCNLQCKNSENTVCQNEPCTRNPYCGPNYQSTFFTEQQQALITDAHNSFRNDVALGNKGPNVTAANMNVLSYSKELEFVAQCWANNCNIGGAHDKCRKIKNYGDVGQNIFLTSSKFPLEFSSTGATLLPIQMWMSQIDMLTPEAINSYIPLIKTTTDVAQIIWAKSKFVGCGHVLYGKGKGDYNLMVVCNYAPASDKTNSPVYIAGQPASECEAREEKNDKYPGLCGNEINDTWAKPFKMAATVHVISTRIFMGLLFFSCLCFFNGLSR